MNFYHRQYVDTWTPVRDYWTSLQTHGDWPLLFWKGFLQDFGIWLQEIAGQAHLCPSLKPLLPENLTTVYCKNTITLAVRFICLKWVTFYSWKLNLVVLSAGEHIFLYCILLLIINILYTPILICVSTSTLCITVFYIIFKFSLNHSVFKG